MQREKSHFEVEGRKALGFDTGLNPAAFAQAKLAQLLSEPGYLVSPEGKITHWRAEGVVERDGRMTVWGPDFPGERLDVVVTGGGDAALEALRRWIAARLAMAKAAEVPAPPAPYPGAAFLAQDGTILFAPERLALRALDARGPADRLDGVDRWVHPDLAGADAETFTAGALAYRVLCGEPPFAAADADALRADMRDGCALSALLVEGGLDAGLAVLVDASLAPAPQRGGPARGRTGRRTTGTVPRPSLSELAAALGEAGSGKIDRFVRPLSAEERAAAAALRARRTKSRDASVGARRFARRNAAIIAALLAVTVGSILIVRSIISDRADLPTTAGMAPGQVAATYYEAFGKLDHTLMEACVVDKAGKGDIDATMNLFVISRVRSAYERMPAVMSATDWIAQGSKPVTATVYGVAGLSLEEVEGDVADGQVTLRARYDLWTPPENTGTPGQNVAEPTAEAPTEGAEAASAGETVPSLPLMPLPVATAREDTLTLVLRDGLWRISAIHRRERG